MKRVIGTPDAPAAVGAYSQGTTDGSLLFTAGQIPMTPDGDLLADESITLQTRQSLENVTAILEEDGLTAEDVLKTTVYMDDIDDFEEMNTTYESFFEEEPPARSAVGVEGDREVGVGPRQAAFGGVSPGQGLQLRGGSHDRLGSGGVVQSERVSEFVFQNESGRFVRIRPHDLDSHRPGDPAVGDVGRAPRRVGDVRARFDVLDERHDDVGVRGVRFEVELDGEPGVARAVVRPKVERVGHVRSEGPRVVRGVVDSDRQRLFAPRVRAVRRLVGGQRPLVLTAVVRCGVRGLRRTSGEDEEGRDEQYSPHRH